jgi:transcriptional regulator with XRE-family HTH domain
MKLFSQRLKIARQQKGLNQEELGKKADLPTTAISHYETGRRKPSLANLQKLANALRIEIDYLLGRKSEMGSAGPDIQSFFSDVQKLTKNNLNTLRLIMQSMIKNQK